MKLKDMPEMSFTLISVVPNFSYWDRTEVPGMGCLDFGHDILEESGKLYIRHSIRLEKDNPSDADLEFLCGVFSDVPHAVMNIKQEVERSIGFSFSL